MIQKTNLLSPLPGDLEGESFETLLRASGDFRIERIVSRGHASPEDFWYNEETAEWVLVLQGRGRLRFADPDQEVILEPGDWIEIPAGARHRVEETSASEETIWLAVHWDPR